MGTVSINPMTRLMLFVVLVAINSIISIGCRTPRAEVPIGTYSDPTSGSYVRVIDGRLLVHLTRDNGRTKIDERECQYDLWPNGRIQLIFYRSSDYAHGIGRMHLLWDGNAIQVIDPNIGK